jgi:hypothetical protein
MEVWNATNALVGAPIELQSVQELGYNTPDDSFVLLQGDIVRTDSAYLFGERITGHSKYVVLNSSCDLVPRRTKCSLLLPLIELRRSEPGIKQKLGELLKFSLRGLMYLPPLPDDPSEVFGHCIDFERVHQIRTDDLHIAQRVASLSLLGWRIFGSFSRMVFSRANQREVLFREAIHRELGPKLAPDFAPPTSAVVPDVASPVN